MLNTSTFADDGFRTITKKKKNCIKKATIYVNMTKSKQLLDTLVKNDERQSQFSKINFFFFSNFRNKSVQGGRPCS